MKSTHLNLPLRLLRIGIVLFLMICGSTQVKAQPNLHQETHRFAGKNMLKVGVNPDGSAWASDEGNFLGFINIDNNTKEFTSNTYDHIQWQKDGIDLTGANSSTFKPIESGPYGTLTYSDCDNIAITTYAVQTNVIDTPIFTFDYPDTVGICRGEDYTFQVEGDPSYRYHWYRNGSPIAGANGQSYAASDAGNYHVGVSADSGVVHYSDTVYLEVVDIGLDQSSFGGTFCYGSTVSLTLYDYTGRETIQWYYNDEPIPGENSVTLYMQAAGDYKLSLSYRGCTIMSEAYELRYDPPLEVALQKSDTRTLCPGESIEITSTVNGNLTGLQYQWSTGATTPNITVNQTGTYQLTVTNARGCSEVAEIEVEMFPEHPPFSLPDTVICLLEEEKVRIEAPSGFASYQWDGVPGQQNWIEIDRPGDHELLVTDANGCAALHTFSVRHYCENITIPNIFSPNGDGINDTWNILGLDGEKDIRIRLFSRTGQIMMDTNNAIPAWDGTYGGSPAPEGAYYYVIDRPRGNKQYKGSLTLIR